MAGNKKTKLIIFSLAPQPVGFSGKTGGEVRMFEILKKFQDKNGTDIFIISTPYNRKSFEKGGLKAEFRIVKSTLKFKSLTGLCLKSIFNIAKAFFVLRAGFPENSGCKIVLYSSSDLFWEVIPAYFFKKRNENVKWVQMIYHIYPDWRKRPGKKMTNFFGYHLQRFSFWLIKKEADKIVLINSLVKDEMRKMGFSESKMFVSPVGIDWKRFENIKKVEPGYDGVFLARLSYSKGILDLAEIWKKVCAEIPEAKLAVIGGGSEETKSFLEKKISDYKLKNNIDILGFLGDNEAHSILKSGKVFLFPSHEEGWGIAIAEAMACGLPVVSWNLPVFKEVFEDLTSQIKEDNIESFSKRVMDLLKNEGERNKTGESGKEFIRRYSWDSIAEKEFEIIFS